MLGAMLGGLSNKMTLLSIPRYRKSSSDIDFLKFQKVIRIDTILILVYIHTYPVFARRINIVQRNRATYRYPQADQS